MSPFCFLNSLAILHIFFNLWLTPDFPIVFSSISPNSNKLASGFLHLTSAISFKVLGNSSNLFVFLRYSISFICSTEASIVLFKFAVSQFTNLLMLFLVSLTTLISSKFSTALLAPKKARIFDISSASLQ